MWKVFSGKPKEKLFDENRELISVGAQKYATWKDWRNDKISQEYTNTVEKAARAIEKAAQTSVTQGKISISSLKKYNLGNLRPEDVYEKIGMKCKYKDVYRYTSAFNRAIGRQNPSYDAAVETCAKSIIADRIRQTDGLAKVMQWGSKNHLWPSIDTLNITSAGKANTINIGHLEPKKVYEEVKKLLPDANKKILFFLDHDIKPERLFSELKGSTQEIKDYYKHGATKEQVLDLITDWSRYDNKDMFECLKDIDYARYLNASSVNAILEKLFSFKDENLSPDKQSQKKKLIESVLKSTQDKFPALSEPNQTAIVWFYVKNHFYDCLNGNWEFPRKSDELTQPKSIADKDKEGHEKAPIEQIAEAVGARIKVLQSYLDPAKEGLLQNIGTVDIFEIYYSGELKDYLKQKLTAAQVGKLVQVYNSIGNKSSEMAKNIAEVLKDIDLTKFKGQLDQVYITSELGVLGSIDSILMSEDLPKCNVKTKENIYEYAAKNGKVDILEKLDMDCPNSLQITTLEQYPEVIRHIVSRYKGTLPAQLQKEAHYSEDTANKIGQMFAVQKIFDNYTGEISRLKDRNQLKRDIIEKIDFSKLSDTQISNFSPETRNNIYAYALQQERLDVVVRLPNTKPTEDLIKKLIQDNKDKSVRFLITENPGVSSNVRKVLQGKGWNIGKKSVIFSVPIGKSTTELSVKPGEKDKSFGWSDFLKIIQKKAETEGVDWQLVIAKKNEELDASEQKKIAYTISYIDDASKDAPAYKFYEKDIDLNENTESFFSLTTQLQQQEIDRTILVQPCSSSEENFVCKLLLGAKQKDWKLSITEPKEEDVSTITAFYTDSNGVDKKYDLDISRLSAAIEKYTQKSSTKDLVESLNAGIIDPLRNLADYIEHIDTRKEAKTIEIDSKTYQAWDVDLSDILRHINTAEGIVMKADEEGFVSISWGKMQEPKKIVKEKIVLQMEFEIQNTGAFFQKALGLTQENFSKIKSAVEEIQPDEQIQIYRDNQGVIHTHEK